ncbi:MAG: type II toxin-antitoxin system prevent-host-death family antitoxin [Bacteroidetes bacterium]|nr:type II toxin-antitoxin system prevent-host-death family antitoxin [Bacteroidota bacterium]
MSAIPSIIPVSELRQDTAGVIKRMKTTQEPVFITQRGRATAVLVTAAAYEKTQYELELLKVLAKGEAEVKAGKGIPLEDVLKEMDAILSETR